MPRNEITKLEESMRVAAEICDRYGDFIKEAISHHCKDESKADDLYQEFFLTLVYIPIPSGIENIRAYLYRRIVNDIQDALRVGERAAVQLEKYQADAVTLHYRDNLSIADVAAKMNIDQRLVSSYLSRGIEKLRRLRKLRQATSTSYAESLVLNLYVRRRAQYGNVANGIVELYRALNRYHVLCGGTGLIIDDWKIFVADGEPVEQPA